MTSDDAAQIVRWVKAGGVLVILENDPSNADLEHVNLLAEQFGIHYNNVLRNRVDGRKFEMGKIAIAGGGAIFHDAHAIYMKEICTITAKSPATPVLEDRGDTLMVTAKVGKGTVFATVDPWTTTSTRRKKAAAGVRQLRSGERTGSLDAGAGAEA